MAEVKISINLITYNRANFIGEVIDSVLLQTFSDWQLIIVDDASTDNTEEIIKKYLDKDSRIKYYKNETHLSISRSRNRSLELSKGKYIAVIDSDDVWCDADKLKKQVDFLEKHPDHVLVGGGVIKIDSNGNEIGRYRKALNDSDIRKKILWQNQFIHSNVMYLRSAAVAVGGYPLDIPIGEDYDLWLKLGQKGKFANLPDYMVKYRIHDGSECVNNYLSALRYNIIIIKRHGRFYPNYCFAHIRRMARLLLYRFILFVEEIF